MNRQSAGAPMDKTMFQMLGMHRRRSRIAHSVNLDGFVVGIRQSTKGEVCEEH
jgi:hypothetical protein